MKEYFIGTNSSILNQVSASTKYSLVSSTSDAGYTIQHRPQPVRPAPAHTGI
jgi:hypothetical protein